VTRDPGKRLTVAVVGGAGAMGRWAARWIARLGTAERLLIADIDTQRAGRLVAEVGGPCEGVRLDATDPAALRELFARCDAVVNTMGPFSLFAGPILEAAIDCGCDYLDIDDDWESTLEAFDYDARARECGSSVVIGIGGSPGVSNLCAMVAARRLDRVGEVVTGWSLREAVIEDEPVYLTGSSPGAATEHWLLQMSGTIRAWRDGAEQEIKPLEVVDFDYPGKGAARGYTVGHPEAVTLPRHLNGIAMSMNVMTGPDWIFEYAGRVAAEYEAGAITLKEGAARLEDPPPRPAGPRRRDPLSTLWALVRGERDGQPLVVSAEPAAMPPGKMGGSTGAAVAVGLELLRRGSIAAAGVHAPEAVVDPEEFFALYAPLTESTPEGFVQVCEAPRI
jgi:saccharopine dehydrogenase (NAD+, L-lysine forming)